MTKTMRQRLAETGMADLGETGYLVIRKNEALWSVVAVGSTGGTRLHAIVIKEGVDDYRCYAVDNAGGLWGGPRSQTPRGAVNEQLTDLLSPDGDPKIVYTD